MNKLFVCVVTSMMRNCADNKGNYHKRMNVQTKVFASYDNAKDCYKEMQGESDIADPQVREIEGDKNDLFNLFFRKRGECGEYHSISLQIIEVQPTEAKALIAAATSVNND